MPKAKPNNTLNVKRHGNEPEAQAVARAILAPDFRHGLANSQLMKAGFGDVKGAPGIADFADIIKQAGKDASEGDLAFASRLLASQAMTLDMIFAETVRRMACNIGTHLPAMEIYARIAMKAQANSRATLEALAKLHAPREQTVRHVHVNEGGQAVIADQFHHHAAPTKGGEENGESFKQPHATGTAGQSPTLPSPDPCGQGLPIPGGKGQSAMQDARRQRKRSA